MGSNDLRVFSGSELLLGRLKGSWLLRSYQWHEVVWRDAFLRLATKLLTALTLCRSMLNQQKGAGPLMRY